MNLNRIFFQSSTTGAYIDSLALFPYKLIAGGDDDTICMPTEYQLGPGCTIPLPAGSFIWTSTPADPSLAGQQYNSNPIVSPTQTTTYILSMVSGQNPCGILSDTIVIHDRRCCAPLTGNTYLIDRTYNSSQVFIGQHMSIVGTLTLGGSATYIFSGCDMVCSKDSKIIIEPGSTAYFEYGTHLYACDTMWDGIDVANGAGIYFRYGSLIEDAEVAVGLRYGSFYELDNATFNRNYIHVQKTMPIGANTFTGDYRVIKCKFLCQTTASIGLPTPVHEDLLPPRATQRTNMGIRAIGTPKILVGNSLANANTFDNSNWGIYTQSVKRLEVRYNTLRDLGIGVHAFDSPLTGTETIWVSRNTLQRTPYPIYCYDNPRATIKIDTNTVTFVGMVSPPVAMVGIAVDEIAPGNSSNPNKLRITKNNIQNAPCGIRVANLFGNLTTAATTYIGLNTITHTKDVSYGDGAGILMQNVKGVVVEDNNVSHPSSAVNWWEAAIRQSGGNNNQLMCNNTHHIGKGLFFDNDVRNNTRLILNTMDQNQTGIFLNYAIIGPQGSTVNEPNDNTWTTTTAWDSLNPQIENYGLGSSGTLSPFVVHTPGAQYYPQFRRGTNSGVAVPPPLTTNKTWTLGCYFTPPTYKTMGENPAVAEALGMVAETQDAQPTTPREIGMAWAGQYGLYTQLLGDEELRYADENLNAYFTEKESGNMGILTRAMDEFHAIRAGNPDGLSLENISSVGIIASDIAPEQRLAEVMAILYTNIENLKGMADEDEARLREIAQLCPIDDGFGVYIARSALLTLDTLPKNYISECEQVPSPDDVKEKQDLQDAADKQFLVYPNPNNGLFIIEYAMDEGSTGTMSLYDLVGHKIFSRPLSAATGKAEIHLTGVASGLYIVKVEVNGYTELSERISVLRP